MAVLKADVCTADLIRSVIRLVHRYTPKMSTLRKEKNIKYI